MKKKEAGRKKYQEFEQKSMALQRGNHGSARSLKKKNWLFEKINKIAKFLAI